MNEILARFKAGHLGVEHGGKQLRSTPSNMTLRDATYNLRIHQPFTLVLEPGDMTRYVLTFIPVGRSGLERHGYSKADLLDGWLVLRRPGDRWVGEVMNIRWDVGHHNVTDLAAGNAHTENVLAAFLSQLFSLARGDDARP